MPKILLREWQTIRPEPGSPTHAQFLSSPRTASIVAKLAKGQVLEIEEHRRGLLLRTTSFVGFVSLGDLTVVVEPKIQGMELMTLFRYAYDLKDLRLFDGDRGHANATSLTDLLISQLLNECQHLLAQGLYRRYERTEERLAVPRGRLDFAALSRTCAAIDARLPCHHHPRLDDCLHNRVLLAGLHLANDLARDRAIRLRARRLAQRMTDTVSTVRLDAFVLDKLRTLSSRLTVAYEPAITLVELLYEGQGATLAATSRQTQVPGFFFDMNRFFQSLVGRFLQQYLPEHKVIQEQRINGMMRYSRDYNPLRRQAPSPRPDYLVIGPSGERRLFDAKYRDLWANPLPQAMLYQLAIYAMSQKPVGRATILYPTQDKAARDSVIQISDPSAGGLRAEVVQRPVDLDQLALVLKRAGKDARDPGCRDFACRMIASPC